MPTNRIIAIVFIKGVPITPVMSQTEILRPKKMESIQYTLDANSGAKK